MHDNTVISKFKNDGRSEMSVSNSASLPSLRVELEHYVSSDEAACFLKLNPRTVQRLAREGIIPGTLWANGAARLGDSCCPSRTSG